LSAKLTALLLGLIVPVALFSMPFGGPAPEPTATTTAFTFYSGAASATWTPDYGPWSAGVGAWGNLDPAVLTGGSPAVIIAKNPAWALISPSSWISYADTTTNGPANGVTVTFTVDFLLPAGATSSTVSVSALGDDSVIIRKRGGKFYFYQVALVEKNHWIKRSSREYEIGKVFIIRKSPHFKISKISDKDYLVNHFSKQIFTEKHYLDKQLKYLIDFIQKFNSFYFLYFAKNRSKLKSLLS